MDDLVPAKRVKLSNLSPDELREIQDAQKSGYQSNLFKLQIEELLKEIRITKSRKDVDNFVTTIIEFIFGLKRGKEHEITDQTWLKKFGVCCPMVQEPFSVPGKFRFLPPASVSQIGSYYLGTATRPTVSIDLCLVIPKEFFNPKDYLNERYFRKRSLYLSYLAAKLRKCDLVETIIFTHHHGNVLKPLLVLKPEGKLGKHHEVKIFVTPEEDTFKLSRFHPAKNNVRRKWFYGVMENGTQNENEQEEMTTPEYNAAVVEDLLLMNNSEYLNTALSGAKGCLEGIVLLKLWLRQRDLLMGAGGFNGFMVAMYVAYLLDKSAIHTSMNAYQVFKTTLLNISTGDWTTKVISMNTNTESNKPSVEEFRKHHPVVFIDNSGHCNLCSTMDKHSYKNLKHEASLALTIVSRGRQDTFELLFTKSVTPLHKYDLILRLKDVDIGKDTLDSNKLQDNGGDRSAAFQVKILSLLEKSTERRVILMNALPNTTEKWSLDKEVRHATTVSLKVGFILNPDTCLSMIDKGPFQEDSNQSQQSKDFREFWGERSELRRFQDATICEAVVWQGSTFREKRKITQSIIKYILKRHAGIPWNKMNVSGSDLDPLLRIWMKKKFTIPYGTGEEQTYRCLKVYETLCKQLRSTKGLPLNINTIQGVSPVFRHSEVFPPLVTTKTESELPPYTPSIKVICTLEGSGEWPDDLEAVRRVKAAFYIKLSDIIEDQLSINTRINPDWLDVHKDGYVFRIILMSTRELSMFHRLSEPLSDPHTNNHDVKTIRLKQLQLDTVELPKLTSALNGIQQRFTVYNSVVRLAKRWISSQMMSCDVPDICIELVCAGLFLHPVPYKSPGSVLVGFLRFLLLLSERFWEHTPLVINFNDELTGKDIKRITSELKKAGVTDKMYLMTPYDMTGLMWTRNSPTGEALKKLGQLAKLSHDLLQEQISSNDKPDIKVVFRPSLDNYDVLIHLRPENLCLGHQAVDVSKETPLPKESTVEDDDQDDDNDDDTSNSSFPITDFNPPLCYLEELTSCYGNIASFSYDIFGGSVIGVQWNKDAFIEEKFKASNLASKVPVTDNQSKDTLIMKTDKDNVLEHFKYLGKGLVQVIEMQ